MTECGSEGIAVCPRCDGGWMRWRTPHGSVSEQCDRCRGIGWICFPDDVELMLRAIAGRAGGGAGGGG